MFETARQTTRTPLDAPYIRALPETLPPLIFIMGCHRSGTSMLHHLLAYSGAFNYITAYDIVKYDELLYNRFHGREDTVKAALQEYLTTLKTRGLDDLPVGVHYPEEYRFILTTLTLSFAPSARRSIQESFAPHLTQKTLGKFLELCRKKYVLAGNDRPLLLKNPNDFYVNFMQIHDLFPLAKMLFIHRHPLHILNSYLQSFGSILQEKSAYWALLDPGYHRLFGVASLKRYMSLRVMHTNWNIGLLVRRLAESLRYYLDHIHALPQSNCMALRYEDLCQYPEVHLHNIGTFLSMDIQDNIPEQFIKPRHLVLSQKLQDMYTKHLESFKDYLAFFEYPLFP